MFDKRQLLDALALEMRVIRHLASRLVPGTAGWRPHPSQRSTDELLCYLTTGALDLTRSMLSGTWDVACVTGAAPKALPPDGFDAAMERQERAIRALIEPLSDAELACRPAQLPTGETTNVGAALVQVVWRSLVGYRMQLFLYAKASGSASLSTANCWYGVDAPAPEAARR